MQYVKLSENVLQIILSPKVLTFIVFLLNLVEELVFDHLLRPPCTHKYVFANSQLDPFIFERMCNVNNPSVSKYKLC